MKKYRKYWSNDIVKRLYHVYDKGVSTCCDKCYFFNEIDFTYIPDDSLYIKMKNGKKIHIDDIEKRCKHVCIYYY